MDAAARAASLGCWSDPVRPEPLTGGITNANFLVDHRGRRYVVRIGADLPVHQVMRFNELAAARAAHDAGLSPAVVHHEPGALVLDYIEGHALTPAEVRQPALLARLVPLIRACHHEIPKRLRGPVLMFWVFHVLRNYGAALDEAGSRHCPLLPRLAAAAVRLEAAVGPIEVVFGHNDLLAANIIDDGRRLWLIDWDYAGFNSPLFDLGGLASNNELSRTQEAWLLEAYFGRPADGGLRRRFQAMRCASLLRETLWSMVSELHATIAFDYAAYSTENLARFDAAYRDFLEEH